MIQIVIDTASDFTPELAEKSNVHLVPLTVSFGEESFKSGFEISNDDFYVKLAESKELPSTAQVNPFQFEEVYQPLLDQGDEIISIHISSKMSGTYQSAVIAKENLGTDKITVVDSLNVSGAYGLLVHEAIRMRDAGATVAEIVEHLEDIIPRTRLYLVLDTLDYLKKGGRISPSVAFIGGVLGLHPVVTVVNGEVSVLDKVKGKKSTNRWLLNQIDKVPKDETVPIVLAHSNALQKAEVLKGLLADEKQITDVVDIACMGPIVGTHGGPEAVGMMYVEKK